MRTFFDTNVLIAAFIAHGLSNEVFDHCLVSHEICVSEFVLEEFTGHLKQKFGFPAPKVKKLEAFIRQHARIARYDLKKIPSVCRDPDDNHILAAAASIKADCIITGDKDLLVLKLHGHIPILSPSDFWKLEKSSAKA